MERYCDADDVHLVFNRYDVPTSLKGATRGRRQGGQSVIAYHITDVTNIAEMILVKAHAGQKKMVVTWGSQCRATHSNVSHLNSQQWEDNTKLLLHAVEATARYALISWLVLLRGVVTKRRVVPLVTIYEALGPDKQLLYPDYMPLVELNTGALLAGANLLSERYTVTQGMTARIYQHWKTKEPC